ncbi:MAG: M48 family metalloprotease [Candidatus Sumerlaeota bacterium]|nr:M48 family metalloprotease [Candidatus Sumerlaeota bacterium]
MQTDFFAAQREESRRIWLLAVALYGVYFGFFFGLCFAVAWLFFPSNAEAALRALPPALGLSALLWLFQVWFAERHGVRIILETLSARPPDPEDAYHQRLVRIVDELGVAAGGLHPRVAIVPSLDANAFALADGKRSIIGLTEGVVSKLNRDQTQAVAAHEMAHLANHDCRLATWVCAMAAPLLAFADALDEMAEEERGGGPPVFAFLARAFTTLLQTAISRRREWRADAKAVELTRHPRAMAEALFRIAGENHFLGDFAEALTPVFIVPSRLFALDEREGFLADLFSSHPPIRGRVNQLLETVGITMEEMLEGLKAESAPPPPPLESAETAGQRWMLETEKGWEGPLDIQALAEFSAFHPQSWVRREQAAGPARPAFNDPLLNLVFRRNHVKKSAHLCPRCPDALERVWYEGVPVERCPACGGTLADNDRILRVLGRRERKFSAEFRREAEEWLSEHYVVRRGPVAKPSDPRAGACVCPACRAPMQNRSFSYQYFIPVDRCFACKKTWFDAKEFELLQALVERAQDGGNPRPAGWRV